MAIVAIAALMWHKMKRHEELAKKSPVSPAKKELGNVTSGAMLGIVMGGSNKTVHTGQDDEFVEAVRDLINSGPGERTIEVASQPYTIKLTMVGEKVKVLAGRKGWRLDEVMPLMIGSWDHVTNMNGGKLGEISE